MTASFAGGRIATDGVSRVTRDWLRAHWDFGHDLPTLAHPAIVVRERSSTGVPDGNDVRVARGERGSLQWTGDGDRWHGGVDGCSVALALDAAPIRIDVVAMPPDATPHWFALEVALTEAFRLIGLVPLHAAVISRSGKATAIVGPSGAGKSTSALVAARAGWSIVSEDLAWVDTDGMSVHRWDHGLRLRDDSYRRLQGVLSGASPTVDADGKRYVSYARLVAVERSATLTTLAALGPWHDGPSTREMLAPRDRVRVLWEATGAPFTDRGRAAASAGVQRLLDRLTFEVLRPQRLSEG